MSPLERRRGLPPDRRELLFCAARKEFAARGYEGASYNRIIKASTISKGAVYYHFADKSDLFAEVVRDVFRTIAERIGEQGEARSPAEFWSNIREMMRSFDAIAIQDTELGAIGRALYSGGDRSQAMISLRTDAENWVARQLRAGQILSAVRDDLPLFFLTRAVTSMVIGLDRWFLENWTSLDSEQLEQLSEAALNLLRDLAEPN